MILTHKFREKGKSSEHLKRLNDPIIWVNYEFQEKSANWSISIPDLGEELTTYHAYKCYSRMAIRQAFYNSLRKYNCKEDLLKDYASIKRKTISKIKGLGDPFDSSNWRINYPLDSFAWSRCLKSKNKFSIWDEQLPGTESGLIFVLDLLKFKEVKTSSVDNLTEEYWVVSNNSWRFYPTIDDLADGVESGMDLFWEKDYSNEESEVFKKAVDTYYRKVNKKRKWWLNWF